MKKKAISIVTAALVTVMAIPAMSFAADTTTAAAAGTNAATSAAIVADMTFTTPAVKLSLSDAYTRMNSSSQMELLKIAKKGDQAVAKGYSEAVISLNKAEKAIDASGAFTTYDSSNKTMNQERRTFALSIVEPNDQARKNGFKMGTFKNYYTLKNKEMETAISKDNLAIAQSLLKSTNLMYKAGSVAKLDVLSAEMGVKAAQDAYTADLNDLASLKMDFNMYMDYPLMQDITLTDNLTEVPLPTKSMLTSIKEATVNRNEVKEAAFKEKIAKMALDNVKAYPSNSSTYLEAQATYIQAQITNKQIAATMEQDVREKYMDMTEAYQGVQTGKQNVANAMEKARLAQLQYQAGVYTLTQVQEAQKESMDAQLLQAQALLGYNLAVESYNYCSGVGVDSASLPMGQ